MPGGIRNGAHYCFVAVTWQVVELTHEPVIMLPAIVPVQVDPP
jgi:hypothetical protein